MTLWNSYELISFICNKDYSGNIITPERFSMLIKVVNIELFRKKYGLPEQYQPGRPIPKEYIDITLKNTDDMKAFKKPLLNTPVTAGVLPYPSDYAHRDSIVYRFSKTINGVATPLPRPVEILRDEQAAERRGNYTKRPTTVNPIGVMREDGIYIYPTTITEVDFYYYRWPVDPVFAYVLGDGYITYDSAASTEFEWVQDEHITLVNMMLTYIGINLRETDIYQYSELKKAKGE
ncbi:MAG: hypothetical protein WC554_02710 [Clostridia bacterium]